MSEVNYLQKAGVLGFSTKPMSWYFRVPNSIKLRHFDLSIDFGCGAVPRNPLSARLVVGVDLSQNPPFEVSNGLDYRQINAGEKLPFPDNSVDVITSFDVLEHLPRQGAGGGMHL